MQSWVADSGEIPRERIRRDWKGIREQVARQYGASGKSDDELFVAVSMHNQVRLSQRETLFELYQEEYDRTLAGNREAPDERLREAVSAWPEDLQAVAEQLKNRAVSDALDDRNRLAFANGSDVRVGTNLRGGTMQFLHVSELAHVSVHAPWRAREIRTGAINTVPPGGFILKESTHEGGRYGVNYELTRQAMENMGKGELSPLDFRFFFFSWFDQEEYTLPGRGRWSRELDEYFLSLERDTGVVLDAGQKRWYARMARVMGAAMKQEYPGTPQEAFATGEEGSIYGSRIMALREQGRVGMEFQADPEAPSFTAWDLGLSDHKAIWLVQVLGDSFHWLDHYAASQEPLAHYVEKMREWEKRHGVAVTVHLLPHDAARRDAHGVSYVESMARLGLANVRVVPRTTDVWRGINTLRELLERSFFHARTQERMRNGRG